MAGVLDRKEGEAGRTEKGLAPGYGESVSKAIKNERSFAENVSELKDMIGSNIETTGAHTKTEKAGLNGPVSEVLKQLTAIVEL